MRLSPAERAIFVIDSFGKTAVSDGFLQKIIPEIKLVLTGIFILSVLSFNKYEINGLLPFFIMVSFLTAASALSFKKIFLRILAASPFVIFVGIFNPIFDHSAIIFFDFTVWGGIVSFMSILLKFCLTVWASLLLISTTKFQNIASGLKFFKIPNILANQFYFIFRYIRLLLREAITLKQAREARLYGDKKFDIRIFATLAGALTIRSIKRADRIHNAMLARGFEDDIPDILPVAKLNIINLIFLLLSIFCCIFFRFIY